MRSPIYLSHKYLSGTCCVSGIELGAVYTVVNAAEARPPLWEGHSGGDPYS